MTIQGAIAELQNLINAEDIPCYYKGGIKKVIETIQMDLPIEPKRPKGEWEIKECDSIYGKKYILTCPECGGAVSVTEEALPYENFCRECGADMRGDK